MATVGASPMFHAALIPQVAHLLGRRTDLTGRDKIWSGAIEQGSQHPVLGAGYGGFWGLASGADRRVGLVNQSHNGYIDVFLQTGAVGLALLVAYLLSTCGSITRGNGVSEDWAMFGFCFVTLTLIYNYTEAAYISLNIGWVVLVYFSVAFGFSTAKSHEQTQIESE